MSDEQRFEQIGDENSMLRKRNGALLIENAKLKEETEKLKKEAPLQTNQPAGGFHAMRPQTAQVRAMTPLIAHDTLDDVDSELSELLVANQKRLQQLHNEFK